MLSRERHEHLPSTGHDVFGNSSTDMTVRYFTVRCRLRDYGQISLLVMGSVSTDIHYLLPQHLLISRSDFHFSDLRQEIPDSSFEVQSSTLN